MKTLRNIVFAFLCIAAGSVDGRAQITSAQHYVEDSVYHAPWEKNINIFADPRLALLVEKHRSLQAGGVRRMRGYRIQIYSGNDRAAAIERKVDFMRRYPAQKTYMTYTHPQYRIRVGNFAKREDAIELYRETINIYGAAMIVPDNVTVNTLEDDY